MADANLTEYSITKSNIIEPNQTQLDLSQTQVILI